MCTTNCQAIFATKHVDSYAYYLFRNLMCTISKNKWRTTWFPSDSGDSTDSLFLYLFLFESHGRVRQNTKYVLVMFIRIFLCFSDGVIENVYHTPVCRTLAKSLQAWHLCLFSKWNNFREIISKQNYRFLLIMGEHWTHEIRFELLYGEYRTIQKLQ